MPLPMAMRFVLAPAMVSSTVASRVSRPSPTHAVSNPSSSARCTRGTMSRGFSMPIISPSFIGASPARPLRERGPRPLVRGPYVAAAFASRSAKTSAATCMPESPIGKPP